jgi:hypothetical protein
MRKENSVENMQIVTAILRPPLQKQHKSFMTLMPPRIITLTLPSYEKEEKARRGEVLKYDIKSGEIIADKVTKLMRMRRRPMLPQRIQMVFLPTFFITLDSFAFEYVQYNVFMM